MSGLLSVSSSQGNILTPSKPQPSGPIIKPKIKDCEPHILIKENFLSEFTTSSEKEQALKNLGINSTIDWGEIGGYIEQQSDLWEAINSGGGLLIVNDIAERNSILDSKKKVGMLCYVVSEDKYYKLTQNKTWDKANLGGAGIKQADTPEDVEDLKDAELGQIVYVISEDEFWYLKDKNTWGILNNIVVSEEEPSTEALWIDPTGDSEINKEGNLTSIRQSIKTLEQQMSQVIKILQYGAIAGDSSIGGRTNLMESADPINPNEEDENTYTTVQIEPNHLTSTIPNISIKVDTLANFSANYRNLIDGELIWISDKNSLYIYINGNFVSISNGSGGDVPTPEDMTQDDIEKLYFNHLGFINSKNEQYRMEVNDNGNIIVYNTANYDGNIGNQGNYGSYINDYLKINSIFLGGENTKLDSFSACSHNFVELANASTTDINLNGIYLLYRAPEVSAWTSLALRGTIKAGSTFLIRGARCSYKSNVTLDVDTYDQLWKVDDELIQFNNGGGCFYLVCSDGGKFYKGADAVTLDELAGYTPYATDSTLPKGYIDFVGIQVTSKTSATIPAEGNKPLTTASGDDPKDCIFVRSFPLDPCSQAQKAMAKRKSSALWTYINMATKGTEAFPYYSEDDKHLFIPKSSALAKNIFDVRSTFSEDKPNLLNITFGIQATDNGSGATRCFNWVSVGYYDEYIEYKKSTDSWDSATKIYSIDKSNTYSDSNIETFKNIYSRIKWVSTNGTAVTTHKAIVRGLSAGTYDVRVRRDNSDSYIGDTLQFIVRTDATVNSGFVFAQTTDQQAFNYYEYQAWYKAAYALNKNHSDIQFTVNTGDMTQNGNRENEWIDYYNARKPLANVEDMVTIGNNDLCGITPYELGDGTATKYKINHKNIQYYYCFELSESNPAIFSYKHTDTLNVENLGDILSYDNDTFKYYMPSLYSFNYGKYHFICLNSEFTENTYTCYYNDTSITGDVFKQHAFYNMYRWLKNDYDSTRNNIAYMHEIPLSIIKGDDTTGIAAERTIKNGSKLNNSFIDGISKTPDVTDTADYTGGCNFSQFFQEHNIKLCLGGHKHTYSLSYPAKENISTSTGTRSVDYNNPIIDTTNGDGVTYAMCQATGYKLVSNKELPGQNITWLRKYFPQINGSTASASQYYPMYSVFTVASSAVAMQSYAVYNIYKDSKNAFDINNQLSDFTTKNEVAIEDTNVTINY